eukprot:CAMPEP_0201714752 /NCGR_PEP_ID=MMETSP0593-20130828/1091_1 /ASSEMBLY_ACC=CAM_ASM_000672 /TAXON_ID=267983 /ORGANISM="Skeletonema japonicum, Strain CCMP2506" /LENGTH=556 /DNA_ID=CAMNT_0048204055 /DNA_START=48 /DNA_END=1718 /DNA_ORIENTATION=-
MSSAAAATTSAPPAAAAAKTAPEVPPISLSTLKVRYPNLFQTYCNLSSRQLETDDLMPDNMDTTTPIDAATGLATKIMFVDFTETLDGDNGNCPVKADSDGNKFGTFLLKLLAASESGSVGGDACRFFDALYAAYQDITAFTSTASKFEHLIGWIMAVCRNGIGALLERGDPDRNRLLFKYIAEEFKKIFKQDAAALGIDSGLHQFAVTWCGHLQTMLRNVKKEYGEYAENYTFNYIYKPRPKKAAPAPPVASLGVNVAAAAAAAVGKAGPPSPSPTSVAHAPGMKQGGTGQPKIAEDEDDKAWEEEGWVPRTKGGKQKSPNVIRGELQRYIDKCKANRTSTQTAIIEKMGVNNNTYRRFMNPKTYKDQWSALQNGTYWAAAKLLEEVKYTEENAKKKSSSAGGSAKRKAAATTSSSTTCAATAAPASKKSKKDQAIELVNRINAVEDVSYDCAIYDSCPVVVAKIKEFLNRDGVTKALLLKAFGDINSNSLGRFLSGKQQDQCGNITYKKAYVFFEKLRIMEGKAKSKKRLSNEAQNPQGYSTVKDRGCRWVVSF